MISILRQHAFSLAFLVVVFGFLLNREPEQASLEQLAGFTMGTSYRIQLLEIPESSTRDQISADVAALLDEMDKGIFSTYADDSELSRLNRHPVNSPFKVSTHLFEVLSMATEVSRLSGGAFDVTVGPLVNLWGFGPEINPDARVPAAAEIETRRQQIGYGHLELDPLTLEVTKKQPVTIDLSAIAKGYGVDQLASYFDSLGVASYFLEIGGELKIKGFKPGGESWVPAIEAPIDSRSQVYDIFFSRGESIAVAGSGDYRNYFERNGIRYSHEIDPRTGYPITHSLAAAYVIDESAAMADALATAFMVMGLTDSRDLAESLAQPAYFIYKDDGDGFEDHATEQFMTYMEN